MAGKCLISKDNEEQIKELKSDIIDNLDSFFGDDRYYDKNDNLKLKEVRIALIDYVKHLGEKYSRTNYNTITNTFNAILNNDLYKSYAPYFKTMDIRSILDNKGTASEEILRTMTGKMLDDNYNKTREEAARFFIDNAYGNAYKPMSLLERIVKQDLISSFIIDRTSGSMPQTMKDVNDAVLSVKKRYFKSIQDYLKQELGNNAPEDLVDFLNCNISDTDINDLNNFLPAIGKKLAVGIFSEVDLQKQYETGENDEDPVKRKQAKSFLDAYGANLALRHFDDFVGLYLDGIVKVSPIYRNQENENKYHYAEKGEEMSKSNYSQTDEVSVADNIPKLTQILINTSPFYRYGNDSPSSESFLKFQDFVYITSKIKDLIYNEKANDIYLGDPEQEERIIKLTNRERDFVQGKTLRQIIALSRDNPSRMWPLCFKLVMNSSIFRTSYSTFSPADRDLVWSIYKNLYDTDADSKSIYSIQVNTSMQNRYAKDYYSDIAMAADNIFSVKFTQCSFDDGVYSVKMLRDNDIDNVRRDIEGNIELKASTEMNDADSFNSKYQAKPVKATSLADGVQFTIGGNDGFTVTVSENGKNIEISNRQNLVNLWGKSVLNDFIHDILDINLDASGSDSMKSILEYLYKGAADNTGQLGASDALVKLASRILYNKYMLLNYAKDAKGINAVNERIKSLYGEKSENNAAPSYNPVTYQMSVYSRVDFPILNKIAQARAISYGLNSRIQVRDAENNTLSTQTTSRLMGNYDHQVESQIRNNNSAAASTLPIVQNVGLYRGIMKAQEIKGEFGVKQQQALTTAEQSLYSFLYSFVGGLIKYSDGKNHVFGNNIAGFLPSVNADKNTVGTVLFDLNKTLSTDPSVKYADATPEQIAREIQGCFGGYYERMYNQIRNDFKVLNDFIHESGKDIIFDPDTNFVGVNSYIKTNTDYKTVADMLFHYTNEYNKQHRDKPLTFINNIHFIKNGDEICMDPVLKMMLRRYSNTENVREFLNKQHAELLKLAVNSNFTLSATDFNRYNQQPEREFLRNDHDELGYRASDWIGSDGNVIIGKVVNRKTGESISISRGLDIRKVERATGLSNLRTDIKPLLKDYEIRLNPLLERYNDLSYLLTQQFMMTGVGSEISHPGKANVKVPVLIKNSKEARQLESIAKGNVRIFRFPEIDSVLSAYGIEHVKGTDYLPSELNIYNKYVSDKYDKEKKYAAKANVPLIIVAEDSSELEPLKDKENVIVNNSTSKEMILENNYLLDSSKFKAQWKRNVSWTAAMLQYMQGRNDGVPQEINVAILDDITYPMYAATGETTKTKPFDGAMFVSPLMPYWENNSLLDSRVGINKKQFAHFYNTNTGTGGIIKTAGFAITNDTMRNSLLDRNLMRKSTNIPWSDYDPEVGTVGVDITKDSKGNSIDPGVFYFSIKTAEGTKHIAARIEKAEGVNEYYRRFADVGSDDGAPDFESMQREQVPVLDANGKPVVDANGNPMQTDRKFKIESNYQLWQFLGGYRSEELDGRGLLIPSERSIKIVADLAGKIRLKSGRLFMKDANMHYMPTIGAVKHGDANVNPKTVYFDNEPLNYFRMRTDNLGIQLDKEHSAVDADVSLPTQIISASTSMGYTPEYATNLYNALYTLTKQGIHNFRDSWLKILQTPESDTTEKNKRYENFENNITECILRSLINSQGQQGNMLEAITRSIIDKAREGKQLQLKDAQIPYDDPSVFNKLVSVVTTTMTKAGIKEKLDGLLAVLCPSQNRALMYKDGDQYYTLENWENRNGDFEQTIRSRQEDQDTNHSFMGDVLTIEDRLNVLSGNIELGTKYKVFTDTGEQVILDVEYPGQAKIETGKTRHGEIYYTIGYKDLQNMIKNTGYFNQFMKYALGVHDDTRVFRLSKMSEYIMDGRELGAYNVHFKDTNGRAHQLWDLDIMQDVFTMKNDLGNLFKKIEKYSLVDNFIKALYSTIGSYNAIKDSSNPFTSLYNSLLNTPSFDALYNKIQNTIDRDAMHGGEIRDVMIRLSKQYLRKIQQDDLLRLSSHKNSLEKVVTINGQKVEIDPTSIDEKAYEIILPKIFADKFGLTATDSIEEIRNNPYFFTNRLLDKWKTKVEETDYDIELKNANGNHVYIKDVSDYSDGDKGGRVLTFEDAPVNKATDEFGNTWIVDNQGNKKYKLFNPDDKVVVDDYGNYIILTKNKYHYTDVNGKEYTNDIQAYDPGENRKLSKVQREEEEKLKNYRFTAADENGNRIRVKEAIKANAIKFYLNTQTYNSVHISEGVARDRATEYGAQPHTDNYLELMLQSSNSVAQKYAKMFLDPNKKNKVDKHGNHTFIKDTWNLNKNMNNVDAIREYIESNGDGYDQYNQQSINPGLKVLLNISKKMHTSFLQSLDVVAGRIPSQNQQSYMAMKIAGFSNADLNTAYVSAHQFYLQGSDLDIDAVTILCYNFSKNGLFKGWSNQFNIDSPEQLKASMELPFPTGVKIEPEQTTNDFTGSIEKRAEYINYENSVTKFRQQSPEAIRALGKLITVVNNDKISKYSTDEGKNVLDIINSHNASLDSMNDASLDMAAKNYLVYNIRKSINDPANLLEAQSGVDATKEPIAKLAEMSPSFARDVDMVAGNEFNKGEGIAQGAVGKQNVGITAVGLKTFFGATEMNNSILNRAKTEAEQAEAVRLVSFSPLIIGGRQFSTMANIKRLNTSDAAPEVLEMAARKTLDPDAALDQSVFMSLSVDNAKDLKLAIMNGGPDMMGMYTFGTYLGIDPKVLVKIMVSPLGFSVQRLLKGNELEHSRGLFSVISALRYLKNGPRDIADMDVKSRFTGGTAVDDIVNALKKYVNKDDKDIYNTSDKSSNNSVNNLVNFIARISKQDVTNNPFADRKGSDTDTILDVMESVRADIMNGIDRVTRGRTNTSNETDYYKIQVNRIINKLEEYADMADALRKENNTYSTIYGPSNYFDDLVKLACGADELKQLGQLLRLNQEIKNKPDELISYVARVQDIISKRAGVVKTCSSLIMDNSNDRGIKSDNPGSGDLSFDFSRFMNSYLTGSDYYREKIEAYEKYAKYTINPLRLLTTVPQYRGYLETLYMSYKQCQLPSATFRFLIDNLNSFCTEYNIRDKKEVNQVYKSMQNYCGNYMIDHFLQSSQKSEIVIPATSDSRIYANRRLIPIKNKDVTIKLGTEMGNRTFKYFMENVFVPELKKQYKNNKFVQDLITTVIRNPITYDFDKVISLPGTMIPRSDSERNMFVNYKTAFDDLVLFNSQTGSKGTLKIGRNTYKIGDMFIMYNMVVNSNKLGRKTLTALFEDIAETNELLQDYRKYVKENGKTSDIKFPEKDELMLFAPMIRPTASSADVGKYRNPDNGEIMILKKKEKNPRNEGESDYDFESDIDNFEMNNDMMYDVMGDFDGYAPRQRVLNLGNREAVNKNVTLPEDLTHPVTTDDVDTEFVYTGKKNKYNLKISMSSQGAYLSAVYAQKAKTSDPVQKEALKKINDYLQKNSKDDLWSKSITKDGKKTDVLNMGTVDDIIKAAENECI